MQVSANLNMNRIYDQFDYVRLGTYYRQAVEELQAGAATTARARTASTPPIGSRCSYDEQQRQVQRSIVTRKRSH